MIKTKQELIEYLEDKQDTDLFEIIKKTDKSIRTLAQLRYYWGVIVDIIGNYHGMTPIETNESLKVLFKQNTFTDLNTDEFVFLCKSIIEIWQTKYGVKIPTPMNVGEEQSLFASLGF